MSVGRYRVTVKFAAKMPAGSMGKRVSKFEAVLPRGAVVHLVKESPDEGTGEVEVTLDSFGPAMALRDVAMAVELVGSTPDMGPSEDNPFAEVLQASVARVNE